MRIGVVVFPGSNCDRDIAEACHRVIGVSPQWIWHSVSCLPALDVIILPGGFSYGDYLRSGAIAARTPVMEAVRDAAKRGVRVLGVCNGFQILTEAAMLPGVLLPNQKMRFVCRNVALSVEPSSCVFTRSYDASQQIYLPIAHHDGCYYADKPTLERLEGEGRIVMRYVPCHQQYDRYDANPNGSSSHIAAIANDTGTVMGMMPHPERAIDPLTGRTDGVALFESILASAS